MKRQKIEHGDLLPTEKKQKSEEHSREDNESADSKVTLPEGQEQVQALVKHFVELPRISSASFHPSLAPCSNNVPSVSLTTQQADLTLNKTRKFLSTLVPDTDGTCWRAQSPLPNELKDISYVLPSPDGRLVLVVENVPAAPGKPAPAGPAYSKTVLEVLDAKTSLPLFRAAGGSLHGKIYTESPFGAPCWSRDSARLVYSAESMPPAKAGKNDHVPAKVEAAAFSPVWDPPAPPVTSATSHQSQNNIINVSSDDKDAGEVLEEDWGETLTGSRNPSLFVLDVATAKISAVEGVPADMSLGEAQWTPDGKGIVFVAHAHVPVRLGLIYYNTRPTRLYHLRLDSRELRQISDDMDWGVRSPRFSPKGSCLVWLSSRKTWLHRAGACLRGTTWQKQASGAPVTLITLPTSSPSAGPDGPAGTDPIALTSLRQQQGIQETGLCVEQLPKDPWLNDQQLVCQTQFRSQQLAVVVTVTLPADPAQLADTAGPAASDKAVTLPCRADTRWGVAHVLDLSALLALRTSPSGRFSLAGTSAVSTEVLDVHGGSGLVLVKYCEACGRDALLTFRVDGAGKAAAGGKLDSPAAATSPRLLFDPAAHLSLSPSPSGPSGRFVPTCSPSCLLSCHLLALTGEGAFAGDAILLLRPGKTVRSILLYPHGGPHSGYTTTFLLDAQVMAELGYAVVLVNYRGSSGFGEAGLESLPGRCGTQDVADCMAALHATQNKLAQLGVEVAGKNKQGEQAVSLYGGSHGGFLVTHLIGQFPARFCAAVARNPVTDLLTLYASSDIPDWSMVEGNGDWTVQDYHPFCAPLHTNHAIQLASVSPMQNALKVRTPLLLQLGAKDRRVPMSQGLQFYRALRANGAPCRVVMFAEGQHALADTPRMQASSLGHSVLWLLHHDLNQKV